MGHDERREIFERLEALERMAHSRRDERGGWEHGRRDGGHRDRHRDHDHHRRHDCERHDDGFEEKRVIDTIVHLVSERVAHMLDERQGDGRRDEGGEKRIVDLIVSLVSEHVGEIVRAELDRRLGPADASRGSDARPGGEGEPR
jgi:hypothetical protein